MTYRASTALATLALWFAVAIILGRANGVFAAHVNIRWADAWRATPRIAWEPGTQRRLRHHDGRTTIPAGRREYFAVTLPRGFATGQIIIRTAAPADPGARVIAENHQRRQEATSLASGFVMDVQWAELVNNDKRFRFAVESGAAELVIDQIDVRANR